MQIAESKKCYCCKELRPKELFSANKRHKDNLDKRCKPCVSIYTKIHYQKNKEKYAIKNKKYHEAEDKKAEAIRKRAWYLKNRVKFNERKRELHNIRYAEDPAYKLKFLLRSRMRTAIKKNYKVGSAVKDMGCTAEEAVRYLASRFSEGMTWENHGKWHIDHIIPLSSFNLLDRNEYLKAVHHTNLQPLWAEENMKKHDKVYGNC